MLLVFTFYVYTILRLYIKQHRRLALHSARAPPLDVVVGNVFWESVDRQASVLTANAELALIAKRLTRQPPAAEADVMEKGTMISSGWMLGDGQSVKTSEKGAFAASMATSR